MRNTCPRGQVLLRHFLSLLAGRFLGVTPLAADWVFPTRCALQGLRRGHGVDLLSHAGYLALEMRERLYAPNFGRHQTLAKPRRGHGSVSKPNPVLRKYYETLLAAFGPQHWWPGRSAFEVIIGAILTQNTSWSNVVPAVANLRREKLLTTRALGGVPFGRLARLIRSTGCFRQKARKLQAFVRFLRAQYGGSLAKMFRTSTPVLREQLLAVHGIGPETADSILLYAGSHPVFVVDAYTRRILERHGLAGPRHSYEEIQALFERSLPADVPLYNEFHALIVNTGKHYCRSREPRCAQCPLESLLPARTDL